jgi:hypothetical protein
VTKAEAASALHTALQSADEAPLGPTCVFESSAGAVIATLTIEHGNFEQQVQPRATSVAQAAVAGRTTYCGTLGQPMLWAPLSGSEIFVVTARCDAARALAALVLPRIA